MKENKKRIIVWGIICFIFIILSITGIVSHNKGYGKYGDTQTKLEPIATAFNSLHEVIVLTDMHAEAKANKIVVTYINAEDKKEKYEYTYYNENGIEYIANTYETQTGELVAKQMVNAIYRKNGGTDSIYKLYDYNSFGQAKLSDGINLSNKTITININTNLAVTLKGKIKSLDDDKYIKETDLSNLKNELEISQTVTKEVDDIKMYIISKETTIDIYVSYTDKNKERSLKSLANALKVLDPTIYAKVKITNEIPEFKEDSLDYTFTEKADILSITYYAFDETVFKLELKK